MQLSNDSILRSPLFFPFLAVIWGVFYLMFGERLPVSDGFGWDGVVYADIAEKLLQSPAVNDYTVFRIIPSTLIHLIFKLFGIPFTSVNLVHAFQFMDVACMVLSIFVLQKVLELFVTEFELRALGIALYFFSFCVCRFIFYYPVLTDSFGLLLSALMLYLYLTKNVPLLAILSLITAFTWPMLFYMSVFLFAFPFKGFQREEQELHYGWKLTAAMAIMIPTAYYVYYAGFSMSKTFVLQPLEMLLPVAILALGFQYWFLPEILPVILLRKEVFRMISVTSLIIFAALFFLMKIGGNAFNINDTPSAYMSLGYLFEMPLSRGVARPFINLASHFAFFGVIIALILANWKRFARSVRSFGPGISLAVALNLFWLLPNSETRTFSHLLPWLVLFAIISLKGLKIRSSSLWLIGSLAFICSKIWLYIGFRMQDTYAANETIGMPNQKFFMHLGPWISAEMWLVHLLALIIAIMVIRFAVLKHNFAANEKVVSQEPGGAIH